MMPAKPNNLCGALGGDTPEAQMTNQNSSPSNGNAPPGWASPLLRQSNCFRVLLAVEAVLLMFVALHIFHTSRERSQLEATMAQNRNEENQVMQARTQFLDLVEDLWRMAETNAPAAAVIASRKIRRLP